MKKVISIIAVVAMLVPAVQGYAQGPRRDGGQRTEQRSSSRNSSSRQSYSTPRGSETRQSATPPRQSATAPSRSSSSRQSATPQTRSSSPRQSATPQTRSSAPRQGNVTRSTPPSAQRNNSGGHRPSAPPPHHSGDRHRHGYLGHGHNYHHHHCIFDSWRYYSYGGYHNRFICHSYYRDRYFDSLLGYYLYGSFDRPTRLEIGGLSLTRYNGQLKIQNGASYSYMSLWQNQTVKYVYNHTTIEITTGRGYAYIYFFDNYGNAATYQL